MSEFDNASNHFIQWLKANDATISDSLAIKDYRSEKAGRGVVAIKDIKKDELLFSIPRKVLLSEETSQLATKPGMKDILNSQQGWAPLILCLMYELKSENSFWKPYLDILPNIFDTPMFWEEKDIDELAGTGVPDKIGRDDAENLFKSTIQPIIKSHPDVFDENVHNLNLFHICGSLIMAYSFHDELTPKPSSKGDEEEEDDEEEEEGIIAMVPMADMLNHRTGFNNARLFHEPEALQMRAIKDIQVSEQIYNTYGDLCNADLLRKYGFVDEPNDFDIVEISGDLVCDVSCPADVTDEEKDAKVTFLLEEDVLDDYFVIEKNGDIPPELIACVQVFMMSSQEFSIALEKRKVPKPKLTPSVMDKVKLILSKRLEQYKTTLEDDERMLSNADDLSTKKYSSILVRAGEKRILQQTLNEADGPKRKKQRK
ncbi:hypothetical protein K450DRAFT_246787 [Umbelopsis ramanniana AG]|uniref:N-lysine methyltransferase SETD6 n=1 Tax=Umbelopsis ramanniana AG TaxID=1314678 RepID=A0AAD5E6S2_UMBRA|nr:uncharacterized protein K450DRAFT_246787 [Umbelopsis ramanniana AG]KAI8578436.1 hypothetical protein K450DRAFT_246787 [Umbelopsis ramanniana AG]